jgi:hypothetical protein
MRPKFHGNIVQLMAVVQATGAGGQWRELLEGHYQFRGDDGAVLNWWETTRRVSFQGAACSARRLQAALLEQVAVACDTAAGLDADPDAPRRLLPWTGSSLE